MPKDLAIGVFDSGVGGLTVIRELLRFLPAEDLIYLGDTARLPYGTKSGDTVLRYSRKAAGFLASQGIKALVIACNTASAYALPALGEGLPFPVLGVIEPGAEEAIKVSRSGQVGVLATAGTVASQAYTRAIKRLLPSAVVVETACPLFVPLAEEGWTSGEVPRLVARRYFATLAKARPPIDALVLGCTHYPILEEVIREEIQRAVGARVEVVSSARATARALLARLRDEGLLRASGPDTPPGKRRFFVTDKSPHFAQIGERFLGAPITLEWVDLGG